MQRENEDHISKVSHDYAALMTTLIFSGSTAVHWLINSQQRRKNVQIMRGEGFE